MMVRLARMRQRKPLARLRAQSKALLLWVRFVGSAHTRQSSAPCTAPETEFLDFQ